MNIEIAKSCGFCFGVKRAVQIASKHRGASTIGELIHNSQEIARLKDECGVKTLKNINELSGETAIIRTHGITKSDLATLKERGTKVIDATCPFVTKPQQIVEKMSAEGYEIIFFGDREHPESKSVTSYANKVYIVSNADELEKLKLRNKVALISQTTKKLENFNKIAAALISKCKEVRVFNTICDATFKNQEACQELAKRADIMIVIGGKTSSNTKQLFYIASELCDAHHIENADELEAAWFKDKELCGITAGASTPEWIITQIIDKIKQITA